MLEMSELEAFLGGMGQRHPFTKYRRRGAELSAGQHGRWRQAHYARRRSRPRNVPRESSATRRARYARRRTRRRARRSDHYKRVKEANQGKTINELADAINKAILEGRNADARALAKLQGEKIHEQSRHRPPKRPEKIERGDSGVRPETTGYVKRGTPREKGERGPIQRYRSYASYCGPRGGPPPKGVVDHLPKSERDAIYQACAKTRSRLRPRGGGGRQQQVLSSVPGGLTGFGGTRCPRRWIWWGLGALVAWKILRG
jgi:hypothetical protein